MKQALYFGYGAGGHFLRFPNGRRTLAEEDVPGFPWPVHLLDSGLLKNRKVVDFPDGQVHWVCGGRPLWFGFFWWDRSGDARPASNSGFYVQGFGPEEVSRELVEVLAPVAFKYACEQWPDVVKRQLFPLELQPLPDY